MSPHFSRRFRTGSGFPLNEGTWVFDSFVDIGGADDLGNVLISHLFRNRYEIDLQERGGNQ